MPYIKLLYTRLINSEYIFFNLSPELLWAFGAPISWAFLTEIIATVGMVIIFIFVMLTRKYWKEAGYTGAVINMVILLFLFMIYSLVTSEIYWHLSGFGLTGPFYPIAHFLSSIMLAVIKLFLLIIILACIVVYKPYFAKELEGKWEYGILVLIITISMLVMVSTLDLFVGFIAMVVSNVVLFVILGFKRYSNLSMEATIKFFLFGAFSSACLGAGTVILYNVTGLTNIYKIGLFFSNMPDADISFMALLGGLLVLVGILFKLALIPFHFWVGDAFQGTFGFFNSFIAITSKLPVFVYLVKVHWWILFNISPYFATLLMIVGLLSLVGGSLYALTEINFKRFWALSAIVNLGFAIFAMAYGTCTGLAVSLSYMLFYLLNSLFIWIIAIHVIKNPKSSFAFNEFLTKIIKWTSLNKNRLHFAMFISIVIFSLAGLPPGAGFLPKAWLFLHLYAMNDMVLLFIVFLFSFVSMAYYVRLVRFLLFPTINVKEWESFERLPASYTYILILIFLLNLFFIIFFFGCSAFLLKLCFVFLQVV